MSASKLFLTFASVVAMHHAANAQETADPLEWGGGNFLLQKNKQAPFAERYIVEDPADVLRQIAKDDKITPDELERFDAAMLLALELYKVPRNSQDYVRYTVKNEKDFSIAPADLLQQLKHSAKPGVCFRYEIPHDVGQYFEKPLMDSVFVSTNKLAAIVDAIHVFEEDPELTGLKTVFSNHAVGSHYRKQRSAQTGGTTCLGITDLRSPLPVIQYILGHEAGHRLCDKSGFWMEKYEDFADAYAARKQPLQAAKGIYMEYMMNAMTINITDKPFFFETRLSMLDANTVPRGDAHGHPHQRIDNVLLNAGRTLLKMK